MMRPRSAKYCSLSWKRHATRAAEQASHFDEFRDCTHLIFFRRLVRNEKWRMSTVRLRQSVPSAPVVAGGYEAGAFLLRLALLGSLEDDVEFIHGGEEEVARSSSRTERACGTWPCWRVYLSVYGGTGMSGISINGRALEMLSCTWVGALRCGDVDNNCHQRIQDAPVCSLSERRPRLPSDYIHYVVSILGCTIALSFHSVPWRISATSAGRTFALTRPTPLLIPPRRLVGRPL